MDGAQKKGVGLLVIVFLGFWLVQDPTGFGDSAKEAFSSLWDLFVKLFDGFIRFFQSISD